MTDKRTFAVDNLTHDVRRWIRQRWEPPPIVAAALAYELAALIARSADSPAAANTLIDHWAATMKDQIAAFGIGDHP
jgi:hypothetical protein